MKILIVTEAGNTSPSGWTRAAVYRDLLNRSGVSVQWVSRQPEWLVRLSRRGGTISKILQKTGGGILISALSAKIARMREQRVVAMAKGFDTIYLPKVNSHQLISRLRSSTTARLVFDLNDGLWLPANLTFAQGNLNAILQCVDVVTCDNPYGLAYARNFCKNRVLVPDPSQVEIFDEMRKKVERPKDSIRIGWIGSPETLFNLYSIWEALEVIFKNNAGLELVIVGSGYDKIALPRFEAVKYRCIPHYDRDSMIAEVLKMHIGLFPLFDVEDSLARGILKAEIYMSGEVALVASRIGQVKDVVRDGENGMLASSTKDWIEKLQLLVSDHALRERVARQGLGTAREQFSIAKTFEKFKLALGITHSI